MHHRGAWNNPWNSIMEQFVEQSYVASENHALGATQPLLPFRINTPNRIPFNLASVGTTVSYGILCAKWYSVKAPPPIPISATNTISPSTQSLGKLSPSSSPFLTLCLGPPRFVIDTVSPS